MSFSSVDDVVAEITAGKYAKLTGFRTINTGATSAAGRWHEAFAATGSGGTGVLTGTAGVGVALSSATVGSIPQPTVNVTPDTKHVLTLTGYTAAATAVPGFLMLTDLLYMYPSCVVTGTPTTLNNGAAKPTRMNNGAGVQASCIVAGTAIGAATPTLTMTYTDQAGNTGNTGAFTASAASLPIGSFFSGGTLASLGSPVMNLAAGDSGVRELNSYTIATGTTGAVNFMLHRPIATIPLVAANVAGERDLMFQFPSLPQIPDDACLALFVMVGGALVANQIVQFEIGTGWG